MDLHGVLTFNFKGLVHTVANACVQYFTRFRLTVPIDLSGFKRMVHQAVTRSNNHFPSFRSDGQYVKWVRRGYSKSLALSNGVTVISTMSPKDIPICVDNVTSGFNVYFLGINKCGVITLR